MYSIGLYGKQGTKIHYRCSYVDYFAARQKVIDLARNCENGYRYFVEYKGGAVKFSVNKDELDYVTRVLKPKEE